MRTGRDWPVMSRNRKGKVVLHIDANGVYRDLAHLVYGQSVTRAYRKDAVLTIDKTSGVECVQMIVPLFAAAVLG
jgi:hypothetical protein